MDVIWYVIWQSLPAKDVMYNISAQCSITSCSQCRYHNTLESLLLIAKLIFQLQNKAYTLKLKHKPRLAQFCLTFKIRILLSITSSWGADSLFTHLSNKILTSKQRFSDHAHTHHSKWLVGPAYLLFWPIAIA